MKTSFSSAILLIGIMSFLSANNQFSIGNPSNSQTAGLNQKIFIHTNKKNYSTAETIWFKGYLVNSSSHMPDSSAANVYVEIWDYSQNKITGIIAKPQDGLFFGSLELQSGMPDGNYFLVAYTDAMLNADATFAFKQPFYHHNPDYANRIDNKTRRANRNFNRDLENLSKKISLTAFPEGGNLLAGISQRIAIQANDGTGKGLIKSGLIKDNTGKVIVDFQTNSHGFAQVEFVPEYEKSYLVESSASASGIRLPQVMRQGYSIETEAVQDHLRITIRRAPEQTSPSKLTVQGNARLIKTFTIENILLKSDTTLAIPLKEMPTGINRISLVENGNILVAERHVFIDNNDQANLQMRAAVVSLSESTNININIQITDQELKPLKGFLSASVVFDNQTSRDYDNNIFTYLLLDSETPQFTYKPVSFFDYENPDQFTDIDLFLSTISSKDLVWSTNAVKEPQFADHSGMTIIGSISDPDTQLGLSNLDFKLRIVTDEDKSFSLRTNDRGNFSIENLVFFDSTLVEVQPPLLSGRVIPTSKLHTQNGFLEEIIQENFFPPNYLTFPQKVTSRGKNWRRVRSQNQPSPRIDAYGQPDQIIIPGNNNPYKSVLELIRDKAIGVTVTPSNGIIIRGPSSILNQNPPIFIIDGVESQAAFMSTNVNDIERISIYRGASTAAFGSRGASGAMVLITKRNNKQQDYISQNMHIVKGLHKPKEFMSDIFSLPLDPVSEIPVSIFWEPNLNTDANGMASFQFPLIPGIGRYRVIVQGISEEGKIAASEFFVGGGN